MYVYGAAYAGGLAADNAIGDAGRRYDLNALPRVTFTDPQVASVGLTEEQVRASGRKVKTSVLPLDQVPAAIAARNTKGLIKLVAEAETGKLLGAHVLAAEAGESKIGRASCRERVCQDVKISVVTVAIKTK